MELMSESVGILLVLPVSDLGHAAVQRNAGKLCVYFCTSAADWRRRLVCFHNHCLFYVSVGSIFTVQFSCVWSCMTPQP